jgi:organic hydroperoxide reductase OsmC/OhrA
LGREHRYEVTVEWTGNNGSGTSGHRAYERAHDVSVGGKPIIKGSADPAFFGAKDRWNPEDLLVASLSQCHMLSYLALCTREGVVVTSYRDVATGQLRATPAGGGHFVEVVLQPHVTVADASMTELAIALHHEAHEICFIANSVNFPVRHVPTVRTDESAL